MQWDKEQGHIHIDLCEFVTLARRGISESVPTDDAEPYTDPHTQAIARRRFGNASPYTVTQIVSAPPYAFCLHGHADARDGAHLYKLCLCETSIKHPPKEWTAQMRGEGYVTAYLCALTEGSDAVTVTFVYCQTETEDEVIKEETLSFATLQKFFEKCLKTVAKYAAPAVDRVQKRLPSFASLHFPYPHIRSGQEDFMHAVHRAVAHGGKLCAEAPTGIGKTVSVLYPALRAMGEGACHKIFYLTPKTTTAESVRTCLDDLRAVGADVRAVSVIAKERLCPHQTLCRTDKGACPFLKTNRLADAALSLYGEGHTLAGPKELHRVCDAYRVCPYELALTYAELCDVVVCDFNYLFDPSVYLRRFFDRGGAYAFLVDEAHNLPDRVRDMYTATVFADQLIPPSYTFGEHSALGQASAQAKQDFCKLLYAYLKDDMRKDDHGQAMAFAHGRTLPQDIFDIFLSLLPIAEEELFVSMRDKTQEGDAHRRAAREYYYFIKSVCDACGRFDRGYEWFMQYKDGSYSLKLLCIDPSAVICDRLSLGLSSVLFSATLSPSEYYRSLFGLERTDRVLSVESPFDPDRLSISVLDKISTRYSERERTLPAVLRVIAATVSARRGHYMIFSPSFAYNDALFAAFRSRYPKLRAIRQTPGMSDQEKSAFLDAFREDDPSYLLAFCVMGGIYAEGIDLCGDKLIGAVIVGVGMPGISAEREAICAYYDEKSDAGKAYAYMYPGLNKVLQAAGRVIRSEDDRGVLVLIDDRLSDPVYKRSIPKRFHSLKYVSDAKALNALLTNFWGKSGSSPSDRHQT